MYDGNYAVSSKICYVAVDFAIIDEDGVIRKFSVFLSLIPFLVSFSFFPSLSCKNKRGGMDVNTFSKTIFSTGWRYIICVLFSFSTTTTI